MGEYHIHIFNALNECFCFCFFVFLQGLMDINIRQTPSYSHSTTIMDMVTLKTMLTAISSIPHTVIIIMVQPLVGGTIFTSQIMQILITTLTLTVTRTPVPTATIICGQEAAVSAQMR